MEQNFQTKAENLIKQAKKTKQVLNNVTNSLNSSNSDSFSKLLRTIEEIYEVVSELLKLNDTILLKINGTSCDNIDDNVQHLQFYIKEFIECEKIAIFTSVRLTVKRIILKIQRTFNYFKLSSSQDKALSLLANNLDYLSSDCRKFIWFTLKSIGRESILLGRMSIFKCKFCSGGSKGYSTREMKAITEEFSTPENSYPDLMELI